MSAGVPAVVLGDPRGLLKRGPVGMKNPAAWTVAHSDLIAHLIQVNAQIRLSRWYAADKKFTMQGGQLVEASFPDLEQFVYAAVYFRQVFAKRDRLLLRAVDCYCEFVDCSIRAHWVRHEQQCFGAALDRKAWPLTKCTVRELIEAFLYGAGLLHRFPEPGSDERTRFLQLYDTEPPHKVLYALNALLLNLLNYVGHIAVVLRQDFSHWQQTYPLPPPDVRWHEGLFKPRFPKPPV